MTEFLVGTGGWAYFRVPNNPPLKAYSEIFDFVEVNSTFYEYPLLRTVEAWRRIVPSKFRFSVRCHQDLTHCIGIKPTEETYNVFNKMKMYCKVLDTPFLVLETPASKKFDEKDVKAARDFFGSISTDGLQLVWEYRAPFSQEVNRLMQDFGIVQCVDLSTQKPQLDSEVVYSRVFGKGKHNLYQFTDYELIEIEQNALGKSQVKLIAVAFHGARMYNDAARSQSHILNGKFIPATNYFGVESAITVLAEDTKYPITKAQLIENQGWKVIDLTEDKRVHLSHVLSQIPNQTFHSLKEVSAALEAVI